MSDTKRLAEPDLNQCEAEKPNGTNFMTMGGPSSRRSRCTAKPDVIATEREPREDGLRGSMCLCFSCAGVMKVQLGQDYATFRLIGPQASR